MKVHKFDERLHKHICLCNYHSDQDREQSSPSESSFMHVPSQYPPPQVTTEFSNSIYSSVLYFYINVITQNVHFCT